MFSPKYKAQKTTNQSIESRQVRERRGIVSKNMVKTDNKIPNKNETLQNLKQQSCQMWKNNIKQLPILRKRVK